MKNLTIKNIIEYTKGTAYNCESIMDKEVSDVTIDSRKVENDGLFIAIKGARVDGHDLIPEVMEKGVLVSISEKNLGKVDFAYIKVESTKIALQDVARLYREGLNCKIVGISGSVGKTSTKEMVAEVLSTKFKVLRTEGNFNNEIGVPLTLFRITPDIDVAVVEMGINHFGEMTRLAKMTRPDICILTNIGDCHLEFLQNRKGVYKAKSEMFNYKHSENSPIIFNGDDEILREIEKVDNTVPKFSAMQKELYISKTGRTPDAYVTDIMSLGLDGSTFKMHINNECEEFYVPVPGEHTIRNAMTAALVGKELGMSLKEISTGAKNIKTLKGRGLVVRGNGYYVLDDCYNANPVSMKSSLNVLEEVSSRKVAILGDMGELGNNQNELHQEVGKYAASKNIDVCIFVGTLAKLMKDGFEQQISLDNKPTTKEYYYFETKEEFIENSSNILKKEDSILVKASHYMGFDEIVSNLTTAKEA